MPGSLMPVNWDWGLTGPNLPLLAARLGDRGEAMGTRTDIPADPARVDGPRSPLVAGIPGGARAADTVSGLGFLTCRSWNWSSW